MVLRVNLVVFPLLVAALGLRGLPWSTAHSAAANISRSDFYMARHPTVLTALDAVFLPGPSVLLLVELDPPLERALPWGSLIRIPCAAQEFNSLCRQIGASFQRDEKGNAKAVGVGLYGRTSRFYAANALYPVSRVTIGARERCGRAG